MPTKRVFCEYDIDLLRRYIDLLSRFFCLTNFMFEADLWRICGRFVAIVKYNKIKVLQYQRRKNDAR